MFKKNTIFGTIIACIIISLCGCGKDIEAQNQYRKEGITYIRNGEYQEAIKSLDEAMSYSLSVGDFEEDTALYKALAQYLMADYKGAQKTYSSLIDFDKNNWKFYYLRGSCYLVGNDITNALSDFEHAITLQKNDYKLYKNIASALKKAGVEEEANAYLEKALEISGDSSKDDLEKGDILVEMGRIDEAVNFYKSALSKDDRIAQLYIAKSEYLSGDSMGAKVDLEKTENWENQLSEEYLLRGQLKVAVGDYEGALADFKAGAEASDGGNKAELKKGEIGALEHMGEFTMAKNMATDYLKKYPDDKQMMDEMVFLSTR